MSSNSSDIRTNRLVFASLMACLVLLGTILFRIPIPMTQGYVHLGDAMIYTAVLLLGKKQGAAAAALGRKLSPEEILRLARNYPLRREMARIGFERVKSLYTYERFIETYRSIYQEAGEVKH